MRIEMFEVGWISSAAGIWRRDEPMDQTIRFPVPAYLIETETERILIDSGLHPQAVHDPGGRYGTPAALGPVVLEQERSIADHVDLATVTQVVLTHLHYDHAGGLDLLAPSVPVVIQRREWEAAGDADAARRNFLQPVDYAAIADRVICVEDDHDLLGDGSIRLLLTPGHTPGHQSVMIGERLVVGGDVVHFAPVLDDHRFPLFADDHSAQKQSAEQLRVLRESGLEIRPGHDPDVLTPGVLQL